MRTRCCGDKQVASGEMSRGGAGEQQEGGTGGVGLSASCIRQWGAPGASEQDGHVPNVATWGHELACISFLWLL